MKKTVTTGEEIRALCAPGGPGVVLLDSGGFVWWDYEDGDGAVWLHGVATPTMSGSSGMAVDAWLNVMTPERAADYGPFTVLTDGS